MRDRVWPLIVCSGIPSASSDEARRQAVGDGWVAAAAAARRSGWYSPGGLLVSCENVAAWRRRHWRRQNMARSRGGEIRSQIEVNNRAGPIRGLASPLYETTVTGW